MIKEITQYDFLNAFRQSDSRKEQFSYEALIALHSYYEELEESTGEQITFDMVAICCEWTEYDSDMDAINDYRVWELEDLSDMTTVIELETGHILVLNF
jgi:hypothetical protein